MQLRIECVAYCFSPSLPREGKVSAVKSFLFAFVSLAGGVRTFLRCYSVLMQRCQVKEVHLAAGGESGEICDGP